MSTLIIEIIDIFKEHLSAYQKIRLKMGGRGGRGHLFVERALYRLVERGTSKLPRQ